MDKEGFKVKYFKDTIIGMRAIITKNQVSEVFNELEGEIREGYKNDTLSVKTPRFGITFNSPASLDGVIYNGINLDDEDEIYLIID